MPRSVRLFLGACLLVGCTESTTSGPGDGGSSNDFHVDNTDAGCGLRTCQSAKATCGLIGDGCGGLIQCGSCTPPQSCGGGGTPSVCGGSMGCIPRTCQSAGANCGPLADGCGGLLQCGDCQGGQSCGGGGQPSVCGTGSGGGDAGSCVAKTCQQLGFNCGPAGDGCGGQLDCGTCPNGQACGVGGQPSVCSASGSCVPRTCQQQNFNCGLAGDGCGGVIDCGTCQQPGQVCGGGGEPNRCGGSVVDGGTSCTNLCLQQVRCDAGTTTISGTVFAPTNPTLGYGQPDPLPNALVYVPNGQVQAFTSGVSCDQCGAEVSGTPLATAISASDGTFTLDNAPCGSDIPLVIQMGRWRRQIVVSSVACCSNTSLTAAQTHLPRNKSEGDIPLIAISTGDVDPIECALLKIGIDAAEFTNPNGNGRVRIYQDDGASISGNTPAASQLYGSLTELKKYDAVIFDCVGSQEPKSSTNQQHVVDYTNAGGRVFASHYSYVWLHNIAPFSSTANWQINQSAPPNLTAFVDMSFPKGATFANWLQLIGASTVLGRIPVQEVRHDFNSVVPPSQRWLYADPSVRPNTPLEYTFNTPVGTQPAQQCGRVLFSDFHVNTEGDGSGTIPGSCGTPKPLTPQERVLEYMIFDLTSCITPDLPTCTPRTCQQQNANCGATGDGCGAILQCGTCPMGQVCGAGGPNQCGAPTCTPIDCATQGIECGPAGNGCGGAIDCGPCPMGQTCGGGGPGKCGTAGCTPITCQQQGLECGPAGNGCGGAIDCGPCPMGQTCGGGGVAGKCGTPQCMPTTCQQAGAACGFIGDGCGGAIDCGPCPPGFSCGGGGTPNMCAGIG